MARPSEKGIRYFPLDVDFLEDDKIMLLMQEHGSMGVLIYLELLCLAYRDNGYFYPWGPGRAALVARRVGDGCTTEKVELVVSSCARWSLLECILLDGGNVLTSTGIQRRYLAAIRERAKKAAARGRNIEVDGALWLLSEKETAEALVNISPPANLSRTNPPLVQDKPPFVPGKIDKVKESKVKESKVKESKVKESRDAAAAACTPTDQFRVELTEPERERLAAIYGERAVEAKRLHLESWMAQNNKPLRNPVKTLEAWLAQDTPARPASTDDGGDFFGRK